MSQKKIQIYNSINDVNENQWNNVVKQSELGSVFHRTGWLRTIEESLGQTARHFVIEKGGNPIALIPNFVVDIDLPFADSSLANRFGAKRITSIEPGFGGPIFVGSEQSNFELMFEYIDRLYEGDDFVSHRLKTVRDEYVRYSRPLVEHGYSLRTNICRFVLDLEQGWEAIEGNMNSSKRSHLEAARENSMVVHEQSLDGPVLGKFYHTYRMTMDRVDGTSYPLEFFEVLNEEFADHIKLLTVEVEGEFAGGRLYILDESQSTIYAFFRALDDEFFEYYPTELLDEYAMKWGIEHGYETYDLGSTPADFTDGSFTYKSELGAEPRPILAWERGCSTFRWPAYRFGRWYLRNRDPMESVTDLNSQIRETLSGHSRFLP